MCSLHEVSLHVHIYVYNVLYVAFCVHECTLCFQFEFSVLFCAGENRKKR